jgi:DNA invertase Pin-like site-specific DNA recombinase
VQDVQYLIENGGRFISIDNGFDFSKKLSASQQLQFQIFAAFAEFEREIIRERTFEGLARARAQGKKLGRPAKGREYKSITAEQILPYNSPEYSIRQIARLLETSRWRVMQAFKLLEQKGVVIKVVD